MFCFQCEQAKNGTGCTVESTCGKSPQVAELQDLLIWTVKGLSVVAREARARGIADEEADAFTVQAIFSTLTNVNFDAERFDGYVRRTVALRDRLAQAVADAGGPSRWPDGPATYQPPEGLEALTRDGEAVGVPPENAVEPSLRSLVETLIYGVKGVASYAEHARRLGKTDDEIFAFIHRALADSLRDDLTVDEALGLVLECGRINLRTMEILDEGHHQRYGHPTPTEVPLGHRPNKAILISGHDLADLEALLEQTEGRGIDVYTHGEMLPAHGYPELKQRFPHLYGHYGTAWQNQTLEFKRFPGPIVMTTNCLIKPHPAYTDRLFTTNEVGWEGVPHIEGEDYSPVIDAALADDGFTDEGDDRTVMVGFAHNAVLSLANQVVDAVKSGDIRHFFLVGGCDGAKPGRNYYTNFVEQVPDDCVVLTLACGKFRFFDKQLGDIGGIPRLLDVGQCNDAYSAIKIAQALADAFDSSVNDLPLTLVLSWFEQKAVAILLTLLHLGIRGIRIGPTLPAFLSPEVLSLLVENYDLRPISRPDEDIRQALAS
jgi:hydroxylamine reductase